MKIIQIPFYQCAGCGAALVSSYVAGRAEGEEPVVTVLHSFSMTGCKDENKTVFAPVRVHDTEAPQYDMTTGRPYRA